MESIDLGTPFVKYNDKNQSYVDDTIMGTTLQNDATYNNDRTLKERHSMTYDPFNPASVFEGVE